MSFSAKFRGRCGLCDNPIEPGDLIRGGGEHIVGYVHEECGDFPAKQEVEIPRRPACKVCKLEHPGEC